MSALLNIGFNRRKLVVSFYFLRRIEKKTDLKKKETRNWIFHNNPNWKPMTNFEMEQREPKNNKHTGFHSTLFCVFIQIAETRHFFSTEVT